MKKLFISLGIITISYIMVYAIAPKPIVKFEPVGLNDEFEEAFGM